MLIVESLLLLLTEDSGNPEGWSSNNDLMLRGALLSDLMLAGRIEADTARTARRPRMRIVDTTPTGHPVLDDALAAAGLLRHYLAVGAQRGEEPVAWARSLVEARRFTGWHWDEAKARNGIERLTVRTTPGAERARPEPESSGPARSESGPPDRVSPLRS